MRVAEEIALLDILCGGRCLFGFGRGAESAELMARLGFSMLLIMQNEWAKCAGDIEHFHAIAETAGHKPHRPTILTNVSCCESRTEAHERAVGSGRGRSKHHSHERYQLYRHADLAMQGF